MKILVCTDGSDQADRAVRFVREWAPACPAEVTLLGIQETAGGADAILTALRRAQQLLEERKVSAELVSKSGDPVEEIVKRTQEVAYDLVVVGAVRKGLRGPFSMSAKTYRIVKLITPPVLVVMGNPSGLKRILLCSGGKGYIEEAFGLVGQMARCAGAAVTLLHVMPQPPAIYSNLRRQEEDAAAILSSNSELGRNLRREQQLLSAAGIQTEVRLRFGLVLEEISAEIQGGTYDLVVAGSSMSMGPLRTYVLGDVTRQIVDQAENSVLIARHAQKPLNLVQRLRDLFQGFTFSAGERPKPTGA